MNINISFYKRDGKVSLNNHVRMLSESAIEIKGKVSPNNHVRMLSESAIEIKAAAKIHLHKKTP